MGDQRALSAVVGRRLVAALVDVLLWAIILVLAALRFGRHAAGPSGTNLSLTGRPFLIYLGSLFAYYFFFEWLWSRTLD